MSATVLVCPASVCTQARNKACQAHKAYNALWPELYMSYTWNQQNIFSHPKLQNKKKTDPMFWSKQKKKLKQILHILTTNKTFTIIRSLKLFFINPTIDNCASSVKQLWDLEDLDIQGETPHSKINGDSWGNSSIQEENSRMVQLLGTFTNKEKVRTTMSTDNRQSMNCVVKFDF